MLSLTHQNEGMPSHFDGKSDLFPEAILTGSVVSDATHCLSKPSLHVLGASSSACILSKPSKESIQAVNELISNRFSSFEAISIGWRLDMLDIYNSVLMTAKSIGHRVSSTNQAICSPSHLDEGEGLKVSYFYSPMNKREVIVVSLTYKLGFLQERRVHGIYPLLLEEA